MMFSFRHHLKLVPAFLSQFMKARMAYRADFFLALLASITTTILSFTFLFVIFQRIPTLQQWSFHEVLFIYGFSLIPIGIFSLVSVNFWGFGSKYIVDGNFDRILLRPLHPLFQVLFEAFRIESMEDVLIGSALVFYSASKLGIEITLLKVAIFVGLVLCGALLLIAFFSLVTSINFWLEDRVGIVPPVFNLLNLAKYPLTLYSNFLKAVLVTVIPFAYMAFFPSTYFLDKEEFYQYALLTPFVTVVFAMLALIAWRRGILNYGSTGT